MNNRTLIEIRDCLTRADHAGALRLLRSAIDEGRIGARDGIELMLAMRRGSNAAVMEAVETMKRSVPGAYRYVSHTDHAFA